MGKTIWKVQLGIADQQEVALPKDSEVLTVQTQYEVPHVWALVDNDEKEVEYHAFLIRGTGHDCSNLTKEDYLSTFMLRDGGFVAHVFYLGVVF